jgi:hypothetical protein
MRRRTRTAEHVPQNTYRRTRTAEHDNSDAHFVLPQWVCLDQKIQHRDELPQAGDNDDLGCFALRFVVCVKRYHSQAVAGHNDCRHVATLTK